MKIYKSLVHASIERLGPHAPKAALYKEYRRLVGKAAEEKFFKAWEAVNPKPTWLARIERATRVEDQEEATDAVFIDTQGNRIPVQIKSSSFGIEEHKRKYPDFDGVVVSISLDHSHTFIVRRTLDAFKRYEFPKWLYNRS